VTVKHILLPLTGEATSANAAVCALALAKQLDAHVTVGYEDELGPMCVSPDFGASAATYGLYYEKMQSVRQDRKKQARSYFDRAVGTTKLPIVSGPTCKQASTMWIDDEGGNDAPISAFGALTDLVILDAPGNRKSPPAWNVVEASLFGARRPTLIVPPGTTSVDMSNVLIAWNGSEQAAKAVEHALGMIPETAKVTVLKVGELKPGRMSVRNLMDYLGWHCFEAELRQVPDRAHATSQIILDEAQRAGAGIIVMGAYTHSRTRELLFGGVTDFMLRQSPLPVLMAH